MEHFGPNFAGTVWAIGWHSERQPVVYERRFMDFKVAGFAKRIWKVEPCTSAISSMSRRGRLGAHFKRIGKASGL